MNNRELLSPEDVLNKIGASSFRNITKDQLVAFVSSIPDMDKETAIKCIEQFPEFKTYAHKIVAELQDTCNNVVIDNKASRQETVRAYNLILDGLRLKLDTMDLSISDMREITQTMVDVADKIAALDAENKNFLKHILTVGGTVATTALAIGGALLGVKITNRK